MAGVDAVDVAEQYQCVGLHHLCYQSRQLVVVGEHQLGHADGVVLVDDGQHTVLQHHAHAGLLVAVLLAGLEVLLHGEHLTHVDVVFAEEVVVQADELGLPQGGEQLALLHGV